MLIQSEREREDNFWWISNFVYQEEEPPRHFAAPGRIHFVEQSTYAPEHLLDEFFFQRGEGKKSESPVDDMKNGLTWLTAERIDGTRVAVYIQLGYRADPIRCLSVSLVITVASKREEKKTL